MIIGLLPYLGTVKLISKKGEYELEKEANFNKNHSTIYSTSNMDILKDETYEELIIELNKQSKEFRETMLKELEDKWGYILQEKLLKAKKKRTLRNWRKKFWILI